MHKLCEYIDDELMELEDKVKGGGKLSGAEIEYGDKLAHFKKSLLTNEAMEDNGYSGRYRDGRMSNARERSRNTRRDGMGRYSSERGYSRDDEFMAELYELMDKAPDEKTRRKFERFINEMQ